MIQRIQTIYLLIVVLLLAALFWLPYVSFDTAEQGVEMLASGLYVMSDGASQHSQSIWQLTLLTLIAGAVVLINIFLFKRRLLQIRLCAVQIVLLLGLQVMLPLLGRAIAAQHFGADVFAVSACHWHLPTIFPLVGAILSYLALRAIGADEALVRSLDRLR